MRIAPPLRIAALAALAVATAGAAAAQPRITNGTVRSQAASSLPATFRSLAAATADVAWIGYAVPVVDSERTMASLSAILEVCCSSSLTRMPGTFVSIEFIGPRYSTGANGLGSHVSW